VEIEAIQQLVAERWPEATSPVDDARGFRFFEVQPEAMAEVGAFVRTREELAFDCLRNLTGLDRPADGVISVVYELFSYRHRHTVVLRADAERARPRVASVCGVWRAANWLEREVFDLLGVDFLGHPDQRRILLPDDWVGHPLRKDYVEAPEYHGISTVRESMLHIPGRE
jgi:NADH-quinone oxidoreductase subunit C